ncbi:MAG TPA: tryptophan--tRNA ligase [Vicinamibacteria bacterium]|nr:tryptophan--tRNA ligase [Vicinamibacteria bacterium]
MEYDLGLGGPVRVLSGVQPSGSLHLGNYLGAIRQFVALQDHPENECYFFVADLHAMTTIRDGKALHSLALQVATDYIALGLDPTRAVIYRQSDVPQVTELAWMLSTVTPMGLLQRGHAYKDKLARGIAPTHGLFAYPVLMAADVLIVRAERVPVGRDQKQHVEMARDIAAAFNNAHGEGVLRLPEAVILPQVSVVPGTDGRKTSKSYGNSIELFAPESEVRKAVMSIVTDSTPIGSPKPTRGSTLHALLKLLTPDEEWPATRRLFTEGGHGYGELKSRLLGLFLETFRPARQRRAELMRDPGYVESVLRAGGDRTRAVTGDVMADCRRVCGLTG